MIQSNHLIKILFLLSLMSLTACSQTPWNDPYPPQDATKNIMYQSFSERPKHLDPARSYSSNEYTFIGQIYEPPLQYDYLKRPYELTPLTAMKMPELTLYDKQGKLLPADADPAKVDHSVYTIKIKRGIQFQPHPAFSRDETGAYRYQHLTDAQLDSIHDLSDFKHMSYREVTAGDYVYEIKRLAQPSLHSPILGIMMQYIVGLKELAMSIKKEENALKKQGINHPFIDLDKYNLSGVKILDRYTYQIEVKGLYPQLIYWLSMPFFAPMAKEVVKFYSQPGLIKKNIVLDWYPVGTGSYLLSVNNPNKEMVLERNPNYRKVLYPSVGDPGDAEAGLLQDAGKPMPFINKIVFKLEKENIPYWNKFLQGYYDLSGVSSESFDQAISFSGSGNVRLSDEMTRKGIKLATAVEPSVYYMGFNMLDPVVGGKSERARKLRQAIAIAVDYEEFISIFQNGRGLPAQSPIPPGIFGYRNGEQGINPYVYDWKNGRPERKSIAYARKLMVEAGYKDGVDQKTGKPLVLYFDTTGSSPGAKAVFNWYRKQFKKLDIQLTVRSTDYNRFQDKMNKGTAQIFSWGWNADYPDPENFLFLLYGPNGKAKAGGENVSNYNNETFNHLFDEMKNMPNDKARQKVIDQMVNIVRKDSPWLFGFNPKGFSLYHQWYHNAKPNLMAHNTLQYKRIDPILRAKKRKEWNQPILWPVLLVFGLIILSTIPAIITYRKREHMGLKQQSSRAA